MYIHKYLRNRIAVLGGALLIAGIGTQGAMAMEAGYVGPKGSAKVDTATYDSQVGGPVGWVGHDTGKGASIRISELDIAGKAGTVFVVNRAQ